MPEIISILISLFIIEVLLSIDNALVNATIAESLPEEKRIKAIRIGSMLGALFRLVALFFVSIILQNIWIKVLGGLYLVYLAISHLGKVVDEKGHTIQSTRVSFKNVIWQIALADIVFSIDNVISAVSFSEKLPIVIAGVMIGVVSMLFITPLLSKLIHKYKGMPQAAYVIVGLVGLSLCLETLTSVHIGELQKFLAIAFVLLFTVAYEYSKALQNFSNPLLRSLQYLIALPLDIYFLFSAKVRKVMKW